MNDSVAMLSISTQSRTKHGNSCKVFSGAPNTLVSGGAHLFSSTHRTSSAQSETPICRRSVRFRRQRGLRSVKSGGEVAMKMKFVVVNGRTPSPQSFCALCCEPIGESYLRDITTRHAYCDHQCYVGHCNVTAAAIERRACQEHDRYAFARNEFLSADPESSFV
jgi:hypothetical protein